MRSTRIIAKGDLSPPISFQDPKPPFLNRPPLVPLIPRYKNPSRFP